MNRFHLMRWAKRLYPRWLTRKPSDFVLPDADALLDHLRPDFDLPTLAARLRRWHTGAGSQSLQSLLDGLQADSAWPRFSRCLDRVYGEHDWKRLRALAQRLYPEIELPELPVALNSQHRHALRGLLVLGVVLHSNPVPVRAPSSVPGVGGPAVAQTYDVAPPAGPTLHSGRIPASTLQSESSVPLAATPHESPTVVDRRAAPLVSAPLPIRAAPPGSGGPPESSVFAAQPVGRAPPPPFLSS